MRCLSCGEEMAVTAIVPDRALAGFEHRTFSCGACGATERRLVFSRDQPPPPQAQPEPSTAATTPDAEAAPAQSECPSESALPEEPVREEPVREEPVPVLVPPAAWTRAVEKLRDRQAALSLRAEAAKKATWNVRFDQVWQRLVPEHPQLARTNGQKPPRRRSWSPQASARVVIPRRRPVVEVPVAASSPEQIRKFNEFWDSLLQPQLPPPVSQETPLAPLPRSMSLVAIEPAQSASVTARAMLLMRAAHHGAIAA